MESPHDRGGMAEWLKAPVLKTGVRKDRGFESYSLRHLFVWITRLVTSCRGFLGSQEQATAYLNWASRDQGVGAEGLREAALSTCPPPPKCDGGSAGLHRYFASDRRGNNDCKAGHHLTLPGRAKGPCNRGGYRSESRQAHLNGFGPLNPNIVPSREKTHRDHTDRWPEFDFGCCG
jgi:hypothetical protein